MKDLGQIFFFGGGAWDKNNHDPVDAPVIDEVVVNKIDVLWCIAC